MKRKTIKPLFLILLLMASLLLISCGSTPKPEGSTADRAATAEGSTADRAATAEDAAADSTVFNYRFADKSEGVGLLLSNEAYFDGMTQNDFDYRMQETGKSLDEYKAFAKEQVLDYTEEQKSIINKHMERISKVITEKGYKIPELEEIVFVNTTMNEEGGSAAYTHGTHIFFNGDVLTDFDTDEEGELLLDFIIAHEIFHCITRCNSEFRSDMYKIIHFTTQEDDFELPPSVKEYFISNPDVEHHNSFATFKINGKDIDCFTAFVTTRHFEKKGDSFFELGTTALVPVDGTDTYYTSQDAENFDEVFGKNTDYVIDPEECMADNFGMLIAYGMDGSEGKGYPNPEIITSVEDVLKK